LLALDEDSSLKRFPLRTQLLMILALAAFARLWCVTHPRPTPAPAQERAVEVLVRPLPRGPALADAGVVH
jgi:hypothetical protein